ncbi:MAG: hypothetical protein D6791_14870 [Chloroflexi bacterium]|nr:MAG: hypothetical protein D6791_14870 [Chloroflexota bacterium]
MAGFTNPAIYIFDLELAERGVLQVRYPLPYSDLTSPPEEERKRILASGRPLEFSHTLEDQIGGQLEAGFLITGFYEDTYEKGTDLISEYMPTFIATRAIKPPALWQ